MTPQVKVERVGDRGSVSYRVQFTCPFCAQGVSSNFSAVSRDPFTQMFGICPGVGCGRAVLVAGEGPDATLLPNPRANFAPPGVPPQMAEEFREALNCQLAGFHLGASVVGRRVLQQAVRAVVGRLKNLYTEIKAVPDATLSTAVKDAADHVRLIGNDAAHEDPVTPDDAAALLEFTEQVLQILYVTPAKVAALTAKRSATP